MILGPKGTSRIAFPCFLGRVASGQASAGTWAGGRMRGDLGTGRPCCPQVSVWAHGDVPRRGLHRCLLLCRPYRSGTFEALALLAAASLSVKWGYHRESHRTRNGGRPCRVWRRRPGLSLLCGVSCFVPDSCDGKKDKLRAPVNTGEWVGRRRQEPCLVGFQHGRLLRKGLSSQRSGLEVGEPCRVGCYALVTEEASRLEIYRIGKALPSLPMYDWCGGWRGYISSLRLDV